VCPVVGLGAMVKRQTSFPSLVSEPNSYESNTRFIGYPLTNSVNKTYLDVCEFSAMSCALYKRRIICLQKAIPVRGREGPEGCETSRPDVHQIPARVQCTVQVCELACRTCTPHHTVAGRSSVSLTQRTRSPQQQQEQRPSPHQLHVGHSSTHHRTLCVVHGLCTSVLDNRLTASRAGHLLPPGRLLVLISVRG
jgi:hypothetical protein